MMRADRRGLAALGKPGQLDALDGIIIWSQVSLSIRGSSAGGTTAKPVRQPVVLRAEKNPHPVRETRLPVNRAPDPLGLEGIWRSGVPNCDSASATALTTAGTAAMVGVSPMPFTPSGLNGLGVPISSTVKSGRCLARGMA